MNIRRVFVVTVFIAYGVTLCQQTVSGNRCIEDLTKVFTVQLQCSAGEWIHVVHEVYGDRDAATCRLKSAKTCSKQLDSSKSGLVVNCNGRQSCYEAMKVPSINNCNITAAAAEIKYNCIKGSMNMCSAVTTTVNGSVYLHSPGFLDSVGVNSSCVVRITGQTLQVTLVEQRMKSGLLNISGDGRRLWTNGNMVLYNRVLQRTAAQIVIVYDNHDRDGSNLWIKVADSGRMNITVTGEILDASTTPTSIQQPSRSQSTSGPSTLDTTSETAASTQSTAIVAASFTTTTSTHGHTTNSAVSKATRWPSKSTTMVSTTVSITDTVTMRSAMTCAQRGDITVELQCSVNERIHVKEEWYGYGATNLCRFQANGSCREVLQTSIQGLVVNCNGEQSCNETVSSVTCNLAAPAAAEVHYKCINDSMDICGFDTINAAANESVYLHSPGYPNSVGLNKSCVVRITGKGIQVTLVEQSLNGGNLTLSGNGNKWSNENTKLYNRKPREQYSEVAISYTNGGNDRSNVWISVVGSSPMSVMFNGGMITTSATSTSLVPMSEGSSPQHVLTSQRMSVTQSVMPTSTISNDTQTLSTVPTSALITTMRHTSHMPSVQSSQAAASVTTVTSTHGPTTHSTGRHNSETSSVQSSQVTASFTTTSSTPGQTTHSSGSKRTQRTTKATTMVSTLLTTRWVVSLAVPCAVSCVVFAIITIILCRYRQKRQTRSQDSSTDRPLELDTSGSAEPNHLYFVPDPAFINLNNEEVPDAEAASKLTDTRPEHEQYSEVLPRHLRFNQNDKAHISGNRAEMVDNFLYSISKHELIDERADDAILENMDTCLVDDGNVGAGVCYMTENDIYCGGPATTGTSAETISESGDMPKEICVMVDNDIYSGGEPDTVNVMI